MLEHPTLDTDGYPTEETLDTIRSFGVEKDPLEALRFLAEAWHWPEFVGEREDGLYIFATGGWSGNESLICALHESSLWRVRMWMTLELAGGLFIIPFNKAGEKKLAELLSFITSWAWGKEEVTSLVEQWVQREKKRLEQRRGLRDG